MAIYLDPFDDPDAVAARAQRIDDLAELIYRTMCQQAPTEPPQGPYRDLPHAEKYHLQYLAKEAIRKARP